MKAWLSDAIKAAYKDIRALHKSWTIWFNGVGLTLIELLPYLAETFPELEAYVSPEFYKQATTVLIIGNILLRFKTRTTLREKGK